MMIQWGQVSEMDCTFNRAAVLFWLLNHCLQRKKNKKTGIKRISLWYLETIKKIKKTRRDWCHIRMQEGL
jgi:hypothetical protein